MRGSRTSPSNHMERSDSVNLSGCRFKYGGSMSGGSYADATSSTTYGLMFGHVESEPFEQMSGNVESVNIFNARGHKNYLIANNYNDSAIKFEAEVVTCDGTPISSSTIREIQNWLFYSNNYKRLYVLDDDAEPGTINGTGANTKRLFLYCRFVAPKKIEGNGGVIGFSFSIEADSHLLYQDSTSYSFDSLSSPVTVTVDSDMHDYIYPKITCNVGSSGGDIKLTINNNGETISDTQFVDLTGDITLIINSEYNFISGDNYSKLVPGNFPRLLNGNNNITVTGDVSSISVEFMNRRYM